jgi:hypothetical protein
MAMIADVEELIERVSRAHGQRKEEWLWKCLYKAMDGERWTLTPEIRTKGMVVTSDANRNAVGFLWDGKPIGALTWNNPAGQYREHDEFPFPYNP